MSVVYKPLMLVVDEEDEEEEEEDDVVEEKVINDLESRPNRSGLDGWIGSKVSTGPFATKAPFAQQQSRSHSVCHTGAHHQSRRRSSISLMLTKMQRSMSVNAVEVNKPVNGFVFNPLVQVDR